MLLLTDQELVARAHGGSPDAMAELWRRYHSGALLYARGLVADLPSAEDVCADAFAGVWLRVRAGVRPESFGAYLFRAVKNRSADHYRRQGRVRSVGLSDEVEDTGRTKAGARTGPDFVDSAVDRELVMAAMATLSQRYREVLWRSLVEGIAPAQIAEEQGISSNAACVLVHRARRALRAAYQKSVELGQPQDGSDQNAPEAAQRSSRPLP